MAPTATTQPALAEVVEAEPAGTALAAPAKPGKVARAKRPALDPMLAMFERLATDPRVDVTKLQQLQAMQEHAQQRIAEQAFNVAMADAQGQMRRVAADADNSQTKSRYATYAALDRALRPIYTAAGFGLSFTTDTPQRELEVRLVCHVSHVGGFARDYHIDMPADGKGAKGGDVMTRTHATGSAVSYGMRYLLKMIFNVAVGDEVDDDGNAAGRQEPPPSAPAGFDRWFDDMEALAESDGIAALSDAWNKSKREYKEFVTKHRLADWQRKKAKAEATTRAKGGRRG